MVYIVFVSIVSDLAAKKHPKKQKNKKQKQKNIPKKPSFNRLEVFSLQNTINNRRI